MCKLIAFNYARKGYKTIHDIIYRYAPPSENDSLAYVRFVVSQTGIQSDKPLDGVSDYAKVIKAMCQYESRYEVNVNLIGSVIYSLKKE